MNRRSFLTAIPAAVAAVASLKGAGATMTSIPPANTFGWSMAAGVRYCENCDKQVFPDGARIDDNHIAVRFDDYSRGLTVFLDGEDVGNRCVEAYAGQDGWVILDLWEKGSHRGDCPDCIRMLHELHFGDVQVQRKGGAA